MHCMMVNLVLMLRIIGDDTKFGVVGTMGERGPISRLEAFLGDF